MPPWGTKPPSTPTPKWVAQTRLVRTACVLAAGIVPRPCPTQSVPHPSRRWGNTAASARQTPGWMGHPAMPPSRHIESPAAGEMARPAVIFARRVPAEPTPKALNNKAQGKRSGVAALVPPWGTKPPSTPTPKWVAQTRSARTAYVLAAGIVPRPCPTRSSRFARLCGRSRSSTVPYKVFTLRAPSRQVSYLDRALRNPSPTRPGGEAVWLFQPGKRRDGWGARDGMVPATRQSSKIGTFCRFSSTATKTTSASVTSTCSSGSLLRLDTTRTLMVIDVRPMRSAWA